MDEHVLPAVIANDEPEALLRIEEFDDALSLADDLRGHSATGTAAAPKAAASTSAAAAEATASGSTAAVASATTAAESAAVTKSTAAAVAAAFLESAAWFADCFFAESVTFITAARAAVAFAPSVETHARPNFRVPTTT
jgi:hypothetical protein